MILRLVNETRGRREYSRPDRDKPVIDGRPEVPGMASRMALSPLTTE